MIYTSERAHNGPLSVNSCCERILTGQDFDTLRPKGRVDFGLQYIHKGMAYSEEGGLVTPVPAGSLILHFPGVPQHYFFDPTQKSVLMYVHFTGADCARLAPLRSDRAVIRAIHAPAEFERTFRRMISAYNLKEPCYDLICSGYLTVLMGLLLKSATVSSNTTAQGRHEGLEQVINHMYTYFAEPIDLNHYAAMCYVSTNRFLHLFKEHTGVSPYHFQLKIRIDRAAEMLSDSNASVNECAAAAGFHDTAYFSRIFKRFTGKRPSEFRQ